MTRKLSTIPDFISLPHSKLTNNFEFHNENGEAVITQHGFIRKQSMKEDWTISNKYHKLSGIHNKNHCR